MSSNFGRSIFVSGLCALPVLLVLPYAVDAVAPSASASAILSGESAVAYYGIAWVLITLSALISSSLLGKGSEGNADADQDNYSDTDQSDGAEGKETGTVKWFNVNKGFGFITTESGDDIFVHFRSIRGRGRRSLRQGQTVLFDTAKGDKGLQAENVSVVGK